MRNEVVAMPMLRVQCNPGPGVPIASWPKHVQCLPPVGSMMESNKPLERAYVEGYIFCADGIIEIELTNRKPVV